MADNPGLRHVPTGTGMALQPRRAGMVARGRRDAAAAAANVHYEQGVLDYAARNLESAAENFLLAAEQGHAESQYLLSTMYDAAEGVPQDAAATAHWERKAAEQGHAYAQANLSFRHYQAEEFPEAFEWCQRAAHSQLPWAQFNVGLMCRRGEGTVQSDMEAARWYRLAADQGFAEAEQKLADLYCLGRGVPLNYELAGTWYGKAARQGNAEAQFQLAQLYSTGQGVEQDYVQSRYWMREAALQGHEQAARELLARGYRDP